MLIACPQCGAANDEHAQACYVCDAVYPSADEAIQREAPVPKSARAMEKSAPRKRASRARKVKATAVPPTVAVEELAPIVKAVKEVVAQEAAPAAASAEAIAVPSPEENEKLIQAMAEALDKELRPIPRVDSPQPALAASEEHAAEPESAPLPAPQAESVEEILTAAAEDLRAAQETLEEAAPEILEPAIVESRAELAEDSNEPAEVIGFAPAQSPAREAAPEEAAEEIPEEMPVAVAAGGREESAPVLTLRSSARESSPRASAEPARNVTSFPGQEPEWRREVQRRLQNYRAKRRRVQDGEAQPQLPFAAQPAASTPEDPAYRESLRIRSNGRAAEPPKPRVVEINAPAEETPVAAMTAEPEPQEQEVSASASHAEAADTVEAPQATEQARIEVPVMQPEFHFTLPDEADHPHAPLVPVADVRERSRAVGIDLACIVAGYGFFLGIFAMLGGHFSFGKPEAGILAVTFFLLYAAYFVLFTAFGGATPGMYFRGLSVVNFDGAPAGPRQLLWRSFGYLVSGVTILGFLWAWWDEDHLTWHDRISQTYLTTAESPMWADFAATAFPEHNIPGYDDEDDSAA